MDRNYGNHSEGQWVGPSDAVAVTTFALSSAYTYNSAGRALAFPVYTDSAGSLTDVWIYVSGYTGTWGSTNGNVNFELRNCTVTRIPGTTLVGSATLTLDGSTTGYIKVTLGSPIAGLTANTQYYAVIGDSDGGGTNFVTLGAFSGTQAFSVAGITLSSTAGFGSAGTVMSGQAMFACKIGSYVIGGIGIANNQGTTASDTLHVGNAFTFDRDVEVIGCSTLTDTLLVNDEFRIYLSSQVPSTSTGSLPVRVVQTATSFTDFSRIYCTPTRLAANTKYYAVILKAIARTTPRIQTFLTGLYSDTDLKKLLPLGGNCFRVVKTAAGTDTWTEDTTAIMSLALMVQPVTDPTLPSAANVYTGTGTYGYADALITPTKVVSSIANATAGNIKSGVTIGDVTGTYVGSGSIIGS